MAAIPTEDERESIWSVPSQWVTFYLSLFTVQSAACAGFVVWHEIFQNATDTWPETVLAIARNLGPFIIVIAAGSMMQVEAIVLISTWILEKYKAKRFSEGRAEGRAEERKKWAAWNQRREAAEAAGEKFNELPPLGEDVF